MKKKIIFLIFAIGGILVLAIILTLTNKNSSGTASLRETTKNLTPEQGVIYSFYKDDDLDGLSNAKEKIYGSSARTPDTDGDGYLDGDEVDNGYDPIVAGSARISQRTNLSLTIKYFLWAREEKGIYDPKIEKGLLGEFSQKYPEATNIKLIDQKEIKLISQNNREAVRNYLSALNKISLPEGVASYREIAESYAESSTPLLEDLLAKIELAYLDFIYLQVPPVAKDIQQGYLTIVKEFSNLFSDLRFYQENPVKIELNLKKAQKLIELSQEVERQKLELIKKFEIS